MSDDSLPEHVYDECPKCESSSASHYSELDRKPYSLDKCGECGLVYSRKFDDEVIV